MLETRRSCLEGQEHVFTLKEIKKNRKQIFTGRKEKFAFRVQSMVNLSVLGWTYTGKTFPYTVRP